MIFRHSGSWAAGLVINYRSTLLHPSGIGSGRPNFVGPGPAAELLQISPGQQRERMPSTVSGVIGNLAQKSIATDRSRIIRFVERCETELTMPKASILERPRREIVPDDVKRYLGDIVNECRSLPSLFIQNFNETRDGPPKRTRPPNRIVASTKPRTGTVPEERNDAQLTPITTTSALTNSTFPMLIPKNKTFDKPSLEVHWLFEGLITQCALPRKLSSPNYSLLTGSKTCFFRKWLASAKERHSTERSQ